MRSVIAFLLTLWLSSVATAATTAAEPPREWIDPDTGHRVVRLSDQPGTESLYFHQNAYSPDGRKLIVTTPDGLAAIELATRKITPVAKGPLRVIVTGEKSGNVYYIRNDEIYATHIDTHKTRKIAKLPPRGRVVSVNADETLLLGSYTDGDEGSLAPEKRPTTDAQGKPLTYHQGRETQIRTIFNQRLLRTMFTIDTKTGEMKTVHQSNDWLNHLQFSPTDPTLIMFCHEGPWHEVDRLWTIRTDGSQLTKVHTRTMHMEIWGHEFFSPDGKSIWYDLQTPRGEVFWVAGVKLETGERTWYHLKRDEWSVHFNVSRDGTLFAGDGGDEAQVASARDGKWIYLFRPRLFENKATGAVSKLPLIRAGELVSERLVNLSAHHYRLEPNVTFTPDMKWVIFRSNMHGASHVYAVEIAKAIDRKALVERHNPTVAKVDPASPFMVGNGNIAFTADITGLQTFQSQYSKFSPLLTQAQWAWHSFPNPKGFKYEDGVVPVNVDGYTRHYGWLKEWSDASRPEILWLRENPHRFSLGRLSLRLISASGAVAQFEDLSDTRQTLDMWTGTLSSAFLFDGEPVKVETRVHPTLDIIVVNISSPLLAKQRLAVDLKFPGVSAQLNPDPADWDHPEGHQTRVKALSASALSLERQLDETKYCVDARSEGSATFAAAGPHTFRLTPVSDSESICLSVLYSSACSGMSIPDAATSRDAVAKHWKHYWSDGAAVDLSDSRDPRAHELERRIVLSQYLMALNAAGSIPPQEEGLFSNSWNGKFHLEMHPWHAAHFALWGRTELLERSMPWYLDHLPAAKARATAQGVKGAWWPKMVGPEGRDSPSKVAPFILWQQPHPIFLAELIYRDKPMSATLARYRELVFETAELLASLPRFDEQRGVYNLGPPVIPAQEVFPPLTTFNPTFELAYFRFGLITAQRWRERLGMPREPKWDEVLAKLAPLPIKDGLYLATESFPQLWEQARTPACSGGHTAPGCWNRDHPSFLGALGFLSGKTVDRETMRRTLAAVSTDWDLRQTWGWDYPLIAMTAARLHEPETAIDYLLFNGRNNQYGISGMTPRVHLDAHADSFVPGSATTAGIDGPGYQRAAETYFPSNGGLLLAVGMMAGGWDGEKRSTPGFPADGNWVVRAEGLRPLP